MIIAGFTGTKEGLSQNQHQALSGLLNKINVLHHGDCVGADEQAHNIVVANPEILIYIHPPLQSKLRAYCKLATMTYEVKPYIERNHDIVDATNCLIACPKEESGETLRSGTWATVRYARKLKRKIFVVRPSGRIEIEN